MILKPKDHELKGKYKTEERVKINFTIRRAMLKQGISIDTSSMRCQCQVSVPLS
jgi:hypothetical protein